MSNWKKILLFGLIGLFIVQAVFLLYKLQSPPPVIKGFYGVRWDDSSEEIKEKLTSRFDYPRVTYETHKNHPEGPTRVWGYRAEELYGKKLENKQATVSFWLREKEGLIKGIISVDIDPSRCGKEYLELLQSVLDAYPSLEAEQKKANNKPEQHFCQSLADKEAQWLTIWNEPASKAGLRMQFDSKQNIQIIYHSPKFEEIEKFRSNEVTR